MRQQVDDIDDAVPPHRCNDAKFGRVAAQCIDQHGLLSDQQVAYAVSHSETFLCADLGITPEVPSDREARIASWLIAM